MNNAEQNRQISHSEALAEESTITKEEILRTAQHDARREKFFSHSPFPFFLPRNAFTLAEVLITLGIIGVVAAMTIPTLVQNYQEKVLVTQFKKTYSLLNQAYLQAVQENGAPNSWDVTCLNDVVNYLVPYFQVTTVYAPAGSNYGDATKLGYSNSDILTLDKSKSGYSNPQIKIKSGEVFNISYFVSVAGGLVCKLAGDPCFTIIADINGIKKPNRFGVDVFLFTATPGSIVPWVDPSQCNPSAATANWGSLGNGYACGNWVLLQENMDYLKCVDGGQTAYCHTYSN